MAKSGYVRATYDERTEMIELLKEHLVKSKNSEYFAYRPGWSDERIAKTVNPRFTASHALSIRIEKFGKRKPWSKDAPANDDTLEDRVKRLEDIVDKMQADVKFQRRMI